MKTNCLQKVYIKCLFQQLMCLKCIFLLKNDIARDEKIIDTEL